MLSRVGKFNKLDNNLNIRTTKSRKHTYNEVEEHTYNEVEEHTRTTKSRKHTYNEVEEHTYNEVEEHTYNEVEEHTYDCNGANRVSDNSPNCPGSHKKLVKRCIGWSKSVI